MFISGEHKFLLSGCEGEVARWKRYWLLVVTGQWSPRKMVGLLGPGSQIRRYTPAYQCPNDDVRAGGERRPFS